MRSHLLRIGRLAPVIVCIGLWARPVRAALELTLREASQKWSYGQAGSCSAYIQESNGTDFTLETEVTFPTKGDPGHFPRDSWFGFYVEDTVHKHRYCPGFYNDTFADAPTAFRFGVPRWESGGQFAPAPVSQAEPVPASVKKRRIRLEFRSARSGGQKAALVLSQRSGGDWQVVWQYDAPDNLAPDRVGLCADSNRDCRFGPVIFDEFKVLGDGPAKSDAFDGSVDTARVWRLVTNRMDAHAPTRYTGRLSPGADEFVFAKGSDARIDIEAETTLLVGQSLSFDLAVEDHRGRPVYKNTETGKLAQEKTTLSFTVPAKALEAYGPYGLSVSVKEGKTRLADHYGQFAVVPARPLSKRQDPDSPYLMGYGSSMKLAARLGFRRYRSAWAPFAWSISKQGQWVSPSIDKQVDEARGVGMLLVGPLMSGVIDPDGLEAWIATQSNALTAMFKRYGETVRFIEAGCEPETWPIEPVMNQYILEGYGWAEAIRRTKVALDLPPNKSMELSTASTTHVNLALLGQCARLGGAKHCGWVAVHGYRSPAPPEFGHVEDVAAIRSLVGDDKPIWDTEDAYPTYTGGARSAKIGSADYRNLAGAEYWSTVGPMTQAAYIPRAFITKLAAGYRGVSTMGRELTASPTYHNPSLVSVAYLTSILAHPEYLRSLATANPQLQVMQFRSDNKTVTALWSLQPWLIVAVEADGAVKAADLFGNDLPLAAQGSTVQVAVGQTPVYLIGVVKSVAAQSPWKAGDPRPAVLTEEERDLENPERIRLRIQPMVESAKQSRFAVAVENAGHSRQSGKVSLEFVRPVPRSWELRAPAGNKFSVGPGESAAVLFEAFSRAADERFDPWRPGADRGYAVTSSTEGYLMRAVAETDAGVVEAVSPRFGLSLRGIPRLKELKVDAKPDEWGQVPAWPAIDAAARRNLGLARLWSGPADFDPQAKLAWTKDGLALLAAVQDDWHDQPYTGLDCWRCDSIQIGLNPTATRPDFVDYVVLTMALSPKGVQCVLQRSALGLEAGPAFEVECAIDRRPGGAEAGNGTTIYEARIPWTLLRGFEPKVGNWLSFSLLASDSDGWGRKGWQGFFLSPGGHIVDPRAFGDITLVE